MSTNNEYLISALKAVCALVSSFGVGILVGLSNSPVIHTTITIVFSFIVALIAIKPIMLFGKLQIEVHQFLVPFVVIGIVGGSMLGIYFRANEVFGLNPRAIEKKWQTNGDSISNIKEKLFNVVFDLPQDEDVPNECNDNDKILYIIDTSKSDTVKVMIGTDRKNNQKKQLGENYQKKQSNPNKSILNADNRNIISDLHRAILFNDFKKIKMRLIDLDTAYLRPFVLKGDSVSILLIAKFIDNEIYH